jgi:uncharacterized membrane protein YeaQ/YmgE (transglycosylase-associated protein family)
MQIQVITLPGPILHPGDLLAWLVVGLLAGFIGSAIVGGRGFGCLGNIVVGLIGAVIGGYVAGLLGITGVYHFWGSLLIACLGAVILLAILRLIMGKR